MDGCDHFPKGDAIFEIMAEEAKKQAIPLSGTFELTPRCNFNCKMCYVHLSEERISKFGRELTADEWIDIAEQAKAMGMLYLCITGGEPTLHPEFPKIYKALSQMGFFITLQTNASTLTPKLLKLLEAYPPQQVKITVYGSNDAVYEAVCGVKNGFTRTDRGIRDLLARNIPVFLVTTVIKQNVKDVENIAKYCQSLGVPWINSTAAYPSIRGAETDADAVHIDPEMATDVNMEILASMIYTNIKDGTKLCERCKGYRMSFWIMWNGRMQFCSFMNEPAISILDGTFKETWEKLIDYEENLQWPEECLVCDLRHICGRCAGSLAARSGHANQIDPEYCREFRQQVEKAKAYAERMGYEI